MKVRKQLVTIVAFLFIMVCSLCIGNEANAADAAMVENVMNVKCQVTTGTDASTQEAVNLRLVTSVDSLNYSEIGFKIYYSGDNNPSAATPITAKVDTVFKRIVASAESGVDYNYNPKVISTDSEYFATVTLLDINPSNFDKPFYIKPYCRTLDGQTIYGVSRYVKVSDYYNNIVNVQVKTTDAQAGNMSVVIDDTNAEKLEQRTSYAHDGSYAHLTFKVKNGQELSSVTKFTFKNGDEVIDTAYHRNPLTKYTGGTTYDTSWYEANKTAEKFVIATTADLYGLAEVTKTYNFNNKTIYLGADITVNKGDAKTWSGTEAPEFAWDPMGNTTNFGGTFDGCGDTISGLFTYTSGRYIGLFGTTNLYAKIQNLRLENSYFESTYSVMTGNDGYVAAGSIVGMSSKVAFDSIYSDAIIKVASCDAGGFVGRVNGSNQTHSITNCWFNGSVTSTAQRIGGLAGGIVQASTTMENCLFTGTVSSESYTSGPVSIGGFVGQVMNSHTLTVKNCLNEGTIMVDHIYGVGSVVGGGKFTADFTNVYSTDAVTPPSGKKISPHSTYGLCFGNGATVTLAKEEYKNVIADEITGLNAFSELAFDYTETWVMTTNGHPELKQFATANAMPADTSWYKEASATQKYTITTMEELYGLAVLAQSNVFTDWEFKLGNDITVNSGESDGWATNAPKYMWLPIGNSNSSFNGTFDGQGHTIKGIYLKTTTTRIGLFGDVNTSCQIKNLALRNSYFENPTKGYSYLGSIAGWARKVNLQSVYSDATVISGSSTTALDSVVGGLVGCASTDVQHSMLNCWYAGEIQGDTYVGGMVGWLFKGTMQMTNCLNTGVVSSDITSKLVRLGGFCGQVDQDITFTNCLNLGDIQVNSGNGVGSYVGNAANSYKKATFTNTYSTEKFTVPSGVSVDKDGVGSNTTATTVIATIGTLNVLPEEYLQGYWGYQMTGFDFDDTWVAKAGATPELKAFSKGAHLPITDDVIVADTTWYDASATNQTIVDEADFYGLTKLSLLKNTFAGKVVELSDDMELNPGWSITKGTPKNEWIPIGQLSGCDFVGSFNGNGHVISGVYVDSNIANTGLFGQAGGNNAYIKNFIVRDSYFHNTVGTIGAVAGFGHVDISNIYIEDTVKVSSSGVATGGIVGLFGSNNERTISNCWFAGTVESSYSATFQNCGGIVGQINMGTKTISNCLNTGTVIGNFSANSGQIGVGGIIGRVDKSQYATNLAVTIDSCLNTSDIDVNHQYGAGSIAGNLNAGTVTIQNTYTTDDIWNTKGNKKPDAFAGTGVGMKDVTATYTTGGITAVEENDILGLNGYYNTRLGFYIEGQEESENDVWVVREGDVPAPKPFATAMNLTLPMAPRTDTSWYAANESNKSYTITTKEELAGFSELSQTKNFNGWTITLGNNIVFNKDINNPAYTWTPIGQSLAFAGTFDGTLKTISGVYCKSDKNYVGLFGQTLNGSKIQNLSLKDSYFEYTVDVAEDKEDFACVGSIVGYSNSDLENVYSKATVKGYGLEIGGIVGAVQNKTTSTPDPTSILTSMTTRTYKGCWFDGTITSDHQRVGGIVGGLRQGGLSFENCLFTGTMELSCANTSKGTRAGGILGYAQNTNTKVVFNGIISVGVINNTTGNSNIGTVIGRVSGANEGVILTNVYATSGDFYGSSATTITGTVTEVQSDDRLIGYNDYLNDMGLDFGSTWTLRKTGVPALKIFVPSDEVYTYTDDVLSLTYWGDTVGETVTFNSAMDMGVSNYVMTVTDNNNYYKSYESELVDAGFTKQVSNDTDSDALASKGVYNAVYTKLDDGVNWVLNLTHAGNSKKETYISVTTGRPASEVLSPHMVKNNGITTYTANDGYTTSGKDVTLRMSKIDNQGGEVTGGNGFVIQLPNGHFIINDGGTNVEFTALIDYLCSITDGKKPIIEAWTISHYHSDHANVFLGFIQNPDYVNKVYVEAVYVNEPGRESIAVEPDVVKPIIKNVRKAIPLLKATGNQSTKVYRYQTGQRFYFDGVTMDVVQAQEQISVSTYENPFSGSPQEKHGQFNTTSTGLMFTIDDGTDFGKKVYIGGDQTWVNQDWMMAAYDASLFTDVNVFTILHHGANTMENFTEWSTNNYNHKFDVVLYPRNEVPGGYVFNIYSSTLETASKDGLNSCYSYANGPVLLTFKPSGIMVKQ